MAEKSNPKKEYLLRKMFDGAKALYDFFETMRDNKDTGPREVAEQLKSKYHLTGNQKNYLDGVANRTSRARGIVQYLERRFGVNSDGTFQDVRGLHDLLFDKYTPKHLEARTYNFGVGFTQGIWRKNEVLGYKHCPVTDQNCLTDPLKKTISRLERGAETDCGNLAFRIPSDSRMGKNAKKRIDGLADLSEEKRLVKAIFEDRTTPENLKKEVIEHELRHVIDSIIDNPPYGFFVETPAHLYSNASPSWGLERDFTARHEMFEKRLEQSMEKLEKYQRLKAPQTIVESQRKIIDKCQNKLKQFEKGVPEQYSLFKKFVRRGLDSSSVYGGKESKAVISYLFSTMPVGKMFKRISNVLYLTPNQVEAPRIQNSELFAEGGRK